MSNHDLIFLNYLANVFDNLEDSILLMSVTDEAITPLLVNEGLYRYSGIPKGSMQDLIDELSKSPTVPAFVKLCYEAINQKQEVVENIPIEVPAGKLYTRTKIIPVLNSLAEVTHLVLIARDITEAVLKDEKIAKLEADLKALRKSTS